LDYFRNKISYFQAADNMGGWQQPDVQILSKQSQCTLQEGTIKLLHAINVSRAFNNPILVNGGQR
jgi:hypothetical protein